MKIYSVYDIVAGAYLPVFQMDNDGLALRAFKDAVNNPESAFYNHPNDYQLERIAEFDQVKGLIEESNELIAKASAVKDLEVENIDIFAPDQEDLDQLENEK